MATRKDCRVAERDPSNPPAVMGNCASNDGSVNKPETKP